jgi:hypothetical protein
MPLGAQPRRFFLAHVQDQRRRMANWIATIRKLMPMGQIKTDNERFIFHHFF